MRTKYRFLAMLVMMIFTGCAAAAQAPEASYTQNGFNPRMLDASAPKPERMKLFAHMIALANHGQVRAQDLAGSIYWQGPKISGSPVERDLGQARILLGNAAVHGDVMAMAKLGELELQAGRTAQAMVWAQMYARYVNPMALQRARRGSSAAYASDLIMRVKNAGGKIDKQTKANVGTLVSRFDTSIRRGIDAYNSERRSGHTHLIQSPAGVDSSADVNVNGVAEYIVQFQPDGHPGKVWLLDAFPDAGKMDDMLRPYLEQVLANPVSDNAGMRYLRVSITHNAQKFHSLRPVH